MFKKALRYSRKHFDLFKKLKDITDKRIKARISTAEVAIAIFSLQLANLGSLNNYAQSVSSPSVSTNMVSKVKWGVIRFLVWFYPLFV